MSNRDIGAYSIGGWSIGASEAPANQPPTFTSSPVTSVRATQSYSYSATTTDPEADTITLTAPVLPAWMSFVDNGDGTGTLSGSPTKALAGDHSVTLRATATGGSTDQSFTVHVRNFGIVRGMKGAVQIPAKVWSLDTERDYRIWNRMTGDSEALSTWANNLNVSVVDNADSVTLSDGTVVNLSQVTDDATNDDHSCRIINGMGIEGPPVDGDYSIHRISSVHVKQGTGRYVVISEYSLDAQTSRTAIFDVQTGVWTHEGGFFTCREEEVATGVWRISIGSNVVSSAYNTVRIGLCGGPDLADVNYIGSGDTMYFGGYMVEYIPDKTAAPSPYVYTDGTGEIRRRIRSTTTWTRNAVVSRNYFAHSNDLLSWSGGSTYGAATNIIGPQRVKMFDISDAAPASWTSITNLFDLDYDGVSVVHCSWYVKKDAVANTTRFPGWRVSFTNGYSATCDFRLDTSTGEVSVTTGAQTFDDYGAELVTADGGDEYWHCWFDCTPASPGATNVYLVFYPAIGASSNMAVYSSAAQGTVTSGGYRKDYLSAGAGEPLPYVGDTEGITTTPIGRYVPTNNVIYRYKGAEQPLKDFGALALGFNMDLVTDLVYDLVQDLVRD